MGDRPRKKARVSSKPEPYSKKEEDGAKQVELDLGVPSSQPSERQAEQAEQAEQADQEEECADMTFMDLFFQGQALEGEEAAGAKGLKRRQLLM